MGRSDGLAMPPGTDVTTLTRFLNSAHDRFVITGQTDLALRQVVSESWRRSVEAGLDPEGSMARIGLDDGRLAEIRAGHPLAVAMPVIRRLLLASLTDAGMLFAVSDAAGQLLWVEGDPDLRARAENMHFLPGADWSEASAGTNAPGTALAIDAPVQLLGPEHLARQVTPWSCAAAPIHDIDTGAMLGVLDITGGNDVAAPQTLALVRATVAAVEAELRLERLTPRPAGAHRRRVGHGRGCRPSAAGQPSSGSAARPPRSARDTARSWSCWRSPADGLTAAELAVGISEAEQADVTVRAELSRLRGLLGPLRLDSRPYRLAGELRHGHRRRPPPTWPPAGSGGPWPTYRGPLLPRSEAPGVVELRRGPARRAPLGAARR